MAKCQSADDLQDPRFVDHWLIHPTVPPISVQLGPLDAPAMFHVMDPRSYQPLSRDRRLSSLGIISMAKEDGAINADSVVCCNL